MNYVVLVLAPLPDDLPAAAEAVAKGLPIPADKVLKLLERAPGPVTRPVAERDARRVYDVMSAAGLIVEVREGSPAGPVVDLGALESAALAAAAPAAAPEPLPDPRSTLTDVTASAVRERPEAGQTTTTPPRDPNRTTLVRNPPRLERSGLRRRIGSAVTLTALLSLLVALVAVCITVLPIVRQQEQQRVTGVVEAVAMTIEGLSGGLPLSAPIMRLELDAVQTRAAAAGSDWGLDYLLALDADGTPVMAWYRGQAGLGAFPDDVRASALALASDALAGRDLTPAPVDWLGSLSASGNDLLALVGLADEQTTVAAAQLQRMGAVSGAVVGGAAPSALRQVGAALLTALLVGLVPVLFGVLAVLSLTRALRESINYLLVATDRISHGDLEVPVELRRDDELGQIATAVERMRISLRESMERLRQRR